MIYLSNHIYILIFKVKEDSLIRRDYVFNRLKNNKEESNEEKKGKNLSYLYLILALLQVYNTN
jgi:hypothetical protein